MSQTANTGLPCTETIQEYYDKIRVNWGEVKKKYPMAIKIFSEKTHVEVSDGLNLSAPIKKYVDKTGNVTGYMEIEQRDLYDFFDELNICIFVRPYELRWCYKIIASENYLDFKFINRIEAETAAFTKAFYVLELSLDKTLKPKLG